MGQCGELYRDITGKYKNHSSCNGTSHYRYTTVSPMPSGVNVERQLAQTITLTKLQDFAKILEGRGIYISISKQSV